jgi:hypothetical protein
MGGVDADIVKYVVKGWLDSILDMVEEVHSSASDAWEAASNERFKELEAELSHDEYEPIEDREERWLQLSRLLLRRPDLRTILTIPDEFDLRCDDWGDLGEDADLVSATFDEQIDVTANASLWRTHGSPGAGVGRWGDV